MKESENTCVPFGGDNLLQFNECSTQELDGLLSLQRIQAALGQEAS